jgi:RFX DNA-binding domain
MSGRHSSSSVHHVSPFNSNNATTNNQHHHSHTHNHPTTSRLTRGTVNSTSSALGGHPQDMRVPTFPIDPNLGGPSSTNNQIASTTASTNAAAVLSTPTNQPLPSFQHHHYDTRPQSGGGGSGDPRTQYNSYPQEFHQHTTQQHQTPQTDYSGYDTSFGTEDQGTPTTSAAILQQQQQSAGHQQTPSTPTATDPESQEIRRLAFAALTESVEVLANRTRAEENGPNGEKARQMFGMSWLMRNCEVSAGATPRNRVYARYVSLCASERLKPLNPASFGKLVRAVYPDIKTRRLGVRGQSKYHYCGIKLRDDDPNAPTPDISGEADETYGLSLKGCCFNL